MSFLMDFKVFLLCSTFICLVAGTLFSIDGLPTDEEPVEEDLKHKLKIYPESPITAKRVNDTLNLTCQVTKLEGPFLKWQLEWHLPQNINNRIHKPTSKPGPGNTLLLIINQLQESDSGKYRCVARNDKSSPLQHSVEVTIMPRKGTCGDGMFLCSLSRSCIPHRYVCDGKTDCPDGFDESKEVCGEQSPCDGKLLCDDGRCISQQFCCDKYIDPNCTATYEIACCSKLNYLLRDFPIQPHQQFNEIGFLQSTMYTIIGCAVAFVIILSFTVIAVCRVHVRRSALTNAYAAYRSDPRAWSDLDTYLASNARWTRGFLRSDLSRSPGLVLNSYGVNSDPAANSTLLVTYNINNGVQLIGRPIDPPPYEEVAVQVAREEPPPPYASRENLNQSQPPVAESQHTSRSGGHAAPFLSALFSMLINGPQMERAERVEEDNNNGDINGNSTGQVWVQANSNSSRHDQEVVTNQLNLNSMVSAGSVERQLELPRERERGRGTSHRHQPGTQAGHTVNPPARSQTTLQSDQRPITPVSLLTPSRTTALVGPLTSPYMQIQMISDTQTNADVTDGQSSPELVVQLIDQDQTRTQD